MPGRLGAVVALLVATVAGCDSSNGPPETWAYQASLEDLLAEATAEGASADQLATLRHWIEIQDTPYVDVAEAIQRSSQCMEAAGLVMEYDAPLDGEDYPEVMYRVRAGAVPEDQVFALMEACDVQEFSFVSTAYQMGPGVTERRKRDDAAHLPVAVSCLAGHGIDVSEATTLDQVEAMLTERGLEDPWACAAPPYSNA